MAAIRPFRALRYDEAVAGPLDSLVAAVVLLGAFANHCLHARNPLIDASLFRVRTFTGSSIISLVFSIAFGAKVVASDPRHGAEGALAILALIMAPIVGITP